MDPDRVSQSFRVAVKRAKNVPAIRLHDLRHTWATLALTEGGHPKVVQERLNHANISITLDIYSHVVRGMDAEAAATVAMLFDIGEEEAGSEGAGLPRSLRRSHQA